MSMSGRWQERRVMMGVTGETVAGTMRATSGDPIRGGTTRVGLRGPQYCIPEQVT